MIKQYYDYITTTVLRLWLQYYYDAPALIRHAFCYISW